MKECKYALIIVLIVFIGFAIYVFNISNTLNDKNILINSLYSKIQELEKENINIQSKLKIYEEEHKNLLNIFNLSRRFVEAHVSGDKKFLEELLSDKFILKEKDGKIFAVYKYENETIEVCLHDRYSKYKYRDMIIQGHNYNAENSIMTIHIREFYTDKKIAL